MQNSSARATGPELKQSHTHNRVTNDRFVSVRINIHNRVTHNSFVFMCMENVSGPLQHNITDYVSREREGSMFDAFTMHVYKYIVYLLLIVVCYMYIVHV